MFRQTKKLAAIIAAITVIANCTGITLENVSPASFSAVAADTGSRIRVDINKNDRRKATCILSETIVLDAVFSIA